MVGAASQLSKRFCSELHLGLYPYIPSISHCRESNLNVSPAGKRAEHFINAISAGYDFQPGWMQYITCLEPRFVNMGLHQRIFFRFQETPILSILKPYWSDQRAGPIFLTRNGLRQVQNGKNDPNDKKISHSNFPNERTEEMA